MSIKEQKKHEKLRYTLSKKCVYIVSIYYIVLILIGIVASVLIMANMQKVVADNILLYTNYASISVACMLCSVQYLKRIYKACIEERFDSTKSDSWQKNTGNLLYFFLRPIFASVFVIIAETALLSGVIIVTATDFILNERFLYLCVLMSAVIGFTTGRVLDAFENYSSKKIDDVFEEKNK